MTAYFLSNISAKNYQNRLMYVEVVASQSSVVFLDALSTLQMVLNSNKLVTCNCRCTAEVQLSLSKITDICAFFDEALPECHGRPGFFDTQCSFSLIDKPTCNI